MVTTTITVDDPPVSAGRLKRALYSATRRVCSVFTIERTCESCGGTGSVTTTRERHLDELTTTQMSFLYTAQMERKKAENGVDKDGKPVDDVDAPDMPSNISTPSGSPPISGSPPQF